MSLVTGGSAGMGQASELDLRAIGAYLRARRKWLIGPTVVALGLSFVVVNLINSVYRSEARLLIESGDNPYTRPDVDKSSQADRPVVDQEAISSQVQLALSRDIARKAIDRLELAKRPEFDTALGGTALKSILALTGLVDDPARLTQEERILKRYYERVTAFQVEKSRVVAIQFESWDPELAARGANVVSELYLEAQRAAKQNIAKEASVWLSSEVKGLRQKVEDAEARVEAFRARANLFVGSNNTSLSAQQLAELSSQITAARAQQSDAVTRARLLKDMIKSGKPIEASEVLNWETIRRLTEQKSQVAAQLAEQSSTLGPRHPRIGELRAQTQDLEAQIKAEAERLVRSLENDARIAGARVEQLNISMEQVKKNAASNNEQEVQLRVLEREAKSLRDQLESQLTRYRDATARDSNQSLPADARVVAQATVSNSPSFPKKVPTMLVASLGAFLASLGVLLANAFLSGIALRTVEYEHHGTHAQPVARADVSESPAAMGETLRFAPKPVNAEPAASGSPFSLDEILRRALKLGEPGRCVVFASLGSPQVSGDAALAFARHVSAQGNRIALVDLNPDARLVSAAVGGSRPGLSDLFSERAGFADIIHKDRSSAVHIVGVGFNAASSADLLADDRLPFALEALGEIYDAVVVDAGRVSEATDGLHAIAGLAVLLSESEQPDMRPYAHLSQAGFGDVAVMALHRQTA